MLDFSIALSSSISFSSTLFIELISILVGSSSFIATYGTSKALISSFLYIGCIMPNPVGYGFETPPNSLILRIDLTAVAAYF
jgi:hypothetical protein